MMSLSSTVESLWVRGLERTVAVGVFLELLGLFYLWLADVGCSFTLYVNKAGSKWLRICLLGLYLKPLDV